MLLALVSPALAGLLLNEVMYDPSGADDGQEWIELCNSGTSTLDLTGYTLESAGSSYTEIYTFASGSLAPGAYLVVGGSSSTHPGSFSPNIQNGGSETDGLRVKDASGTVLDTVLYDDPNTTLAEDGGAIPSAGAPAATSGKSFGRFPDCADTNVSATDFVLYTAPSQGTANVDPDEGGGDTGTPSTVDCTGSDSIVINELVYSTDAEWVELYNAGSAPALLDGWLLEFGTSSYSKDAAVPAGTTLRPGEWLVLGSAGALVKDIELDMDLGNASSTDALRLTCNTVPVDTVLYGDPNTDSWLDDSGAVATSLAPDHGTGESLARVQDGYDTDACAADFTVSEAPTPGAANPVVEPPVCEIDGAGSLKINEFIYNPDGTDTGNEWVELYNAGTTALRLDDYTLQGAGTTWGEDFRFPGGVSLAPGEFVLVGGENVGADYLADGMSIDNAGSGAGGLRLLDCEGNVLDTVLYGGDIEDDISGDGGSTEVVPEVSEAVSLGRYPDGGDTDAATDWIPYSAPSPGSANADPAALGGDDTGTGGPKPGGGCNNDGAPTAPGEGGCTTVLPFGGMEVALATVALLRRRRRG
jgi:hypothetical protein